MRVTQSMMVNNMSYWVAQQAEKLQDAQTEVGSGKKINKPSDDPAVAGQIQSDRVSLSQYSQYESNIAQAKTWIDASSATLNTVYSTLQNASNAVYSAGGTEPSIEPVPAVATSSITPTINLYSGTVNGDDFSVTTNIYDSDLKAIPLTITFTKTAANNWSWAAAIPPAMGAIGSGGSGAITFDADGQLVGAGPDPSISLNLIGGATTPQVVTWDIYDAGATNRDLTQYAAKSSIGDNASNIAIGLLTNFYNQILTLANSQYASNYMYAGNLSDTMPFAKVEIDSAGVADDIVFDLAGVATKADIQIVDSAGKVVRNITTAQPPLPLLVAGQNTITWNGHDNEGNDLPEGEYSFIVTASNGIPAVAVEAYPFYSGDDGGKEVLTGVNEKIVLNNDGKDIFSSILSNLSRAITAITNEETDAVSRTGAALQESLAYLEAKQVELSNASVQLGGVSTRVQQLTNNTVNRISELEQANPEKAAIKLRAQQTAYEQVISVTANILKMPKLTDYI